ncbi:putative 5,10-methylenetetrahydrofolate dehydrogenase:5,10-methenyltetrahydrofolate cyclohydrolase [Spinellus fusiger]|nr:putative 5,10-methylenetetrahydrofolate dehydrogenase:5,10-methenyltetrahydrofolate cyclohydrolase [Spinellus fusiger]
MAMFSFNKTAKTILHAKQLITPTFFMTHVTANNMSLRRLTTLPTKILDGKYLANILQTRIKEEVQIIKRRVPDYQPHLAVVKVGVREDSSVYVRMKEKAAKETGIRFTLECLPESISQDELLERVRRFNDTDHVHGIIVQMPLPPHINESVIIDSINHRKDVDGIHTTNVGNLVKKSSTPLFLPCTPKGIIELLRAANIPISGQHAVVIGRSDIVGSPISTLLTSEDATVTLCHSKTRNIRDIVKLADILVVAVGQPELIKGEWIKPGATVIDVGINSISDTSKKTGKRLVGDVNYAEASKVAGAITPVPGGVGPMTVAMLMENTFISFKRWLETECHSYMSHPSSVPKE